MFGSPKNMPWKQEAESTALEAAGTNTNDQDQFKYILQPIMLVLGYSVGWEDLIPIRRPIMTNSWLRGFSSQDSSSFCSLGHWDRPTQPNQSLKLQKIELIQQCLRYRIFFHQWWRRNTKNFCTNPPNFFGERRFALDVQSPVAGTYLPTVSGLPGIPLSPWTVFWSAHTVTGNQRKKTLTEIHMYHPKYGNRIHFFFTMARIYHSSNWLKYGYSMLPKKPTESNNVRPPR